jgi:hypothetical protein
MPSGSIPSWLTATDSTSVTSTPSTTGRQPTLRKPSAGRAARPIGATAAATAIRPMPKNTVMTTSGP